MNKDKFESEAKTLKSFFETYCEASSHQDKAIKTLTCKHHDFSSTLKTDLCKECQTLMDYSLLRLQNCPYEIKPRCRTCPNPCYAKKEWKSLAKVMRYSGLRLGLVKVKERICSVFK